MKNYTLEVNHNNPDIIGRMEIIISVALGYKIDIADILCYPKNKHEDDFRKQIERCLFIQARNRIKARKNLILNQKLLCEQK